MSGENTVILGKKMRDCIKDFNSNLEICFDHGNTKEDDNVKEITLYFKSKDNTKYDLGEADLAIFDGENIRILCEIEETKFRPKLIIGDLMSAILADEAHIMDFDEPLKLNQTHVILGILKPEGSGICKRTKEISERLSEMATDSSLGEIEIICAESAETLTDKVEARIKDILKKI